MNVIQKHIYILLCNTGHIEVHYCFTNVVFKSIMMDMLMKKQTGFPFYSSNCLLMFCYLFHELLKKTKQKNIKS